MKVIDLHPHTMLCMQSEQSFRTMADAMRDDPFSLRYTLTDGTIVNVEVSAKRFIEGFLRLTMEHQLTFWTTVCKTLSENGMVGKLVDGTRYAVTVVRLKTDDNTISLRVSP